MTGWQPQQYDPAAHQRRLQDGRPPQQAEPLQQYPPQQYQGYSGSPATPQGQQQWGTPPGSQPYPQQPPRPARRKRRVFLWVFLAIQVLFIIWIITGLAASAGGPTAAAQAARQCAHGGWQGLFSSQADCRVHYAHALSTAGNAGKGIAVVLIVVVWCVVDFLTGITYLIVRLARRC